MFSFKPIYFVIFALIFYKNQAKISDKRLCIDVNCSELISVGKTLIKYNGLEEHRLSFVPNQDVNVYSHGAGDVPDLIGVEIEGKRGYINKDHFREMHLLKRPKILVDTELIKSKPQVPLEGAATEIKADPTQQPFQVVDGTRIPFDLASLNTEIPAVNVVSRQSSDESTRPLDSVPEKPNINPAEPRETKNVNTEEYKNTEDRGQQQKDFDNQEEEEEDSDHEDDPDDENADDDDIDANDEEKESEKKEGATNVVNSVLSSEKPAIVTETTDQNNNTVNNTIQDTSESKEDTLATENNEKFDSEVNNTEASNRDSTTSVLGDVPSSIIPGAVSNSEQNNGGFMNNAAEDTLKGKLENDQDTPKNITENSPNLQTDTSETVQKELGVEGNNTEESLPPLNTTSAVQNLETAEGVQKASSEPSDENMFDKLPADKAQDVLDSTEEPKLLAESQSLPDFSTEHPIENEAVPPTTFESVTLDPVNSQSIGGISEGHPNPDHSLPSDLTPEFKDPEEAGFSREGNALVSKENQVPEEGGDSKEPVIVDSTDDAVPSKQDDSPQTQDSEDLVQNSEALTIETVTDPTERSDIPQDFNSQPPEQSDVQETDQISDNQVESWGFFGKIKSLFGGENTEGSVTIGEETEPIVQEAEAHSSWPFNYPSEENGEITNKFCVKEDRNCPRQEEVSGPRQENFSRSISIGAEDLQILFIEAFSSDLFLYLITTAFSVIFLVFGMVVLDKCRREGPLIARINKLEQQLLTTMKENEMLQEKNVTFVEEQTQLVVETVPNEVVEELNQKLAEMNRVKVALEEQIQALEKELDTSTEVGIELNKILSEMLNSSDGSDIIKENIEQMQKKLFEQQDTINAINETLSLKETENHELRLEMEISNKKVADLQSELDRMVEKILKIEEERDQQHSILENEIVVYQTKCKEALGKEHASNSEVQLLKQQLTKLQRVAEVKVKEYNTLKESLNEIKSMKNNKDALKSLLEVSEVKAQVEQLKSENLKYSGQLSQEKEAGVAFATKIENLTQEVDELRSKYEKAVKEKVEINTKLQVLNNYFKEKEEQMQKEISKYESLWAAKEGEATSTTERIRYMQEEMQNYKAQNESLKQEIINQEVELKSQISMLEKKAHESWVASRQTERKLEEARQESAQLRNRLTMRERAIAEGNSHARMQSPLHQNGELPLSPPPLDPTQSPPPLFNPRDHLAKSPPIPGMPPPPFLPPPLGTTPFIPPPPLDGMMPSLGDMGGMPPPFMPPLPPGMFPGDHRPPPLGRMSSPPPVGGRYTPESTVYSDYDRYSRRSPSPPYESEYGASPPPIRGYSPYQDRLRDDRREYKRPQARSNGRNSKGMQSSGSENDSLGKITKKSQRKV